LDLAQTDGVVIVQSLGTSDAYTVDKGTIGATQVPDDRLTSFPGDAGVAARDLRVTDDHIAAPHAAENNAVLGHGKTLATLGALLYG
jgi:hypothetical protein